MRSWSGIGFGDSMTGSDMIIGEIYPDEDQKFVIIYNINNLK